MQTDMNPDPRCHSSIHSTPQSSAAGSGMQWGSLGPGRTQWDTGTLSACERHTYLGLNTPLRIWDQPLLSLSGSPRHWVALQPDPTQASLAVVSSRDGRETGRNEASIPVRVQQECHIPQAGHRNYPLSSSVRPSPASKNPGFPMASHLSTPCFYLLLATIRKTPIQQILHITRDVP